MKFKPGDYVKHKDGRVGVIFSQESPPDCEPEFYEIIWDNGDKTMCGGRFLESAGGNLVEEFIESKGCIFYEALSGKVVNFDDYKDCIDDD